MTRYRVVVAVVVVVAVGAAAAVRSSNRWNSQLFQIGRPSHSICLTNS